MSLQPQSVDVVPEGTARVARAAFPKGNAYLRMHEELGRRYADQDFAAFFPTRGQLALAPAQLALVTLMQFAENLSARQAAEAVRALPGAGRRGFRRLGAVRVPRGLLAGGQEALLFERLLARCRAAGLVRARGRQRTDATAVLAAIRTLNRPELVEEALRHALHTLAAVVPDWLRRQCPTDWPERYGPRRAATSGGREVYPPRRPPRRPLCPGQ